MIAVRYQDFVFRNNIMRTIVRYRQLTTAKILCASSNIHIINCRLPTLDIIVLCSIVV